LYHFAVQRGKMVFVPMCQNMQGILTAVAGVPDKCGEYCGLVLFGRRRYRLAVSLVSACLVLMANPILYLHGGRLFYFWVRFSMRQYATRSSSPIMLFFYPAKNALISVRYDFLWLIR
jgi:hypothetical protein